MAAINSSQDDLSIGRDEGVSKGRYFVRLDGVDAEMTYSRAGQGIIIIDHTSVPDTAIGSSFSLR